jgi:hypothetical protein
MKRVIQVAGVVAAALVLPIVSLPFLVNANQFGPRLEAALTSALGPLLSFKLNLSFELNRSNWEWICGPSSRPTN